MNNLSKSIRLMAILLSAMMNGVYAQNTGQKSELSSIEMAEFQTEMQTERLFLSDPQKEEMYKANLKYAEEMKAIRSGERSFSMLRKMKDMGKRKDKEVKQILDKEQFQEYKKMMDEMRKRMRERRSNPDG